MYLMFSVAGLVVIIELIKLKPMLALNPAVTIARMEQDAGVRFN